MHNYFHVVDSGESMAAFALVFAKEFGHVPPDMKCLRRLQRKAFEVVDCCDGLGHDLRETTGVRRGTKRAVLRAVDDGAQQLNVFLLWGISHVQCGKCDHKFNLEVVREQQANEVKNGRGDSTSGSVVVMLSPF